MPRVFVTPAPDVREPDHRAAMTMARVRSVFERRLRAVRHELPGVLAGEVEAVHQMRVASRRLREAVPLLEVPESSDGPGPKPNSKTVRALRRVTRALGGVRELDVALTLLDEFGAARPALRSAVGTVSYVIRWEREVRLRAMNQQLDRIDVKKIQRRVAARLVDLKATGPDPSWTPRLERRIARRAASVDVAVETAGDLYAPARLHGVRIATKKLRYALELARELTTAPTLASTRRLKRMQDLLGRLHDLEVLAGHTRLLDLQAASRGRAHAPIGLLIDAIDKEIRLLHASYLASRDVLADVAARCRIEYCPMLASADTLDRSQGPRDLSHMESYGRNHQPVRRAPRHSSRAGRPVSG